MIQSREELRGRSGSRASRREGRRGDAGTSDGPCSHQRLDTFAGAQDLDLDLVWRTGQAGICMLDRERDQLRPIFDPTRGQSVQRPRTRCLEGARVLRRHSCRAARSSWEFEPVDTRLFVTSDIRAFWTLSSRPWDITKYSVCMHAVCVSVLSARCLRHISVVIPSKPLDRGSRFKNGLRIGNKNHCRVYCLCCDP